MEREQHGFQHRLMLDRDDAGAGWNVLEIPEFHPHPTDFFKQEERRSPPAPAEILGSVPVLKQTGKAAENQKDQNKVKQDVENEGADKNHEYTPLARCCLKWRPSDSLKGQTVKARLSGSNRLAYEKRAEPIKCSRIGIQQEKQPSCDPIPLSIASRASLG